MYFPNVFSGLPVSQDKARRQINVIENTFMGDVLGAKNSSNREPEK